MVTHDRNGWLVPEVYTNTEDETKVLQERIGLADTSSLGKISLKGVRAGEIISVYLGESPGKVGVVIEIGPKQILVAQLSADEFLILTPPGIEKETTTALEISSQNTFVSLIDQTSGWVGVSISGPESTEVMRKLCALSFNVKDFPDMYVGQSSFAKVRSTIIRHDRGAAPTFELFADRSYGEYLWGAILDAGREFGIQPIGWKAMGG